MKRFLLFSKKEIMDLMGGGVVKDHENEVVYMSEETYYAARNEGYNKLVEGTIWSLR